MVGVPDDTPIHFCDERSRGFGVAMGDILPFLTDFDRRPNYNTPALQCESEITIIFKVRNLISQGNIKEILHQKITCIKPTI